MRQSRRGQVDPFIVMDVMDRAARAEAAGRDVVHMEVGQPGTGAPEGARRALAAALSTHSLGYTVGLGLPELRRRIARHYGDWYGVDLDPGRVVVTSGASGAFILAFSALFEAGERVGVGLPGYPSYRHILGALSLATVGIKTRMESRFQPQVADVAGQGLAGLVVASPANPTGTMLDRAALQDLAGVCAEEGIALVSDEIYHGLAYGERAVSALEVTDEVYVVNSFSKYFSMTGWRVGWMVVPDSHVRTVERLAQNLFICAPHASQVAALAAMDCGAELKANVETYRRNREVVAHGLEAAGLPMAAPDGAFYAYADISSLGLGAMDFCARLLDEAAVAATPGLDFDPERGQNFVRFSYAGPHERMIAGMARLQGFVAGLRGA